ncbi:hypothetical protein N7468_007088, partial [Penicillium chermesinum]
NNSSSLPKARSAISASTGNEFWVLKSSRAANISSLSRSPPRACLSTEISSLITRFGQIIKPSTDPRYNVWWSFGPFLEDVPRRLGTNEALDRAIDVLTTSHNDVCNGRVGTVGALAKYSHALRTLSVYVEDPRHAQDSNTLCAVMVLLIAQMFLGGSSQIWSGHTEGAAQILRARRSFGPRDEFEKKLFMSLRGSVLFEGLFNDRICLSDNEWNDLVRSDADQNTPEGRILLLLTQGPSIIGRGRAILECSTDSTSLRDEVWTIYQTCKTELSELKRRWIESDFASFDLTSIPQHKVSYVSPFLASHYERTYGIGLMVTLVFNCMLSALSPMDAVVEFDATYMSEEVLILAERGHQYRPMASGYLLLCASVAWIATTNRALKEKLMLILSDYRGDFQVREMTFMMKEIGWVGEHLRLGRSYRSNAASVRRQIRAEEDVYPSPSHDR